MANPLFGPSNHLTVKCVMALNLAGEVATITQLAGIDAVKLISLIVKAANNARMHKKNCKRFAQHLKLIGNLLEQLKLSELKERPETREPLEELEDALKRAYVLVNSCQNKSYLYLLALGWHTVNQFTESQAEIDSLLRLIPLITLVDNNHRERLSAIERDQQDYTMDDEEKKVQETILKSEPSDTDAVLLQKSLACSYPNLPFQEALQKEKDKLRVELQRMQEGMDLDQCDVIQHLIYVTDSANAYTKRRQNFNRSVVLQGQGNEEDESALHTSNSDHKRNFSTTEDDMSLSHNQEGSFQADEDTKSENDSYSTGKWRNRLFDFYKDPYLCIATFMYPCGTFANIATVVTDEKISQEEACDNYLFFSLCLACYCYTCCVRRKLRKRYSIPGGSCDDFWAHALCFSCALIQEWREVIAREDLSAHASKMRAPGNQFMSR